MINKKSAKSLEAEAHKTPLTKKEMVIDLLSDEGGASLSELSSLAGWQHHSTRSFLTGLKKKGHKIDSERVDGVRRYRIISSGVE